MKLLISITGATGAIYGIRLLEALKNTEHHTALIISRWAEKTIEVETSYTVDEVKALADVVYDEDNLMAAVSSGSYGIDATIIAPCTMKTVAGIANGFSENLIIRTADVALKERRPLILMVRETPISLIHLKNMTAVTEAGGILLPPMPAFYHQPQTIEDIVDQSVGKALDILHIEHHLFQRWGDTP